MLKEAIKTAILIAFSQEAGWKSIQGKKINLYKDFLLPIWCIIAVAAFLGGWFVSRNGSIEIGLKNTFITIFILFIAFYISSYLLNEILKSVLKINSGMKQAQAFVALSLSLFYLIDIVVSLINDFFFLWLFVFYTFYIVYLGAGIFYNIPAEKKVMFTLVATLLILGIPLLITYGVSVLMPG